MDDVLGHKLEDWFPTSPTEGPPLPKWLGILWPWYKEEAPPPTVYTCPYCGATFATQQELDDHIAAAHPTPPALPYKCPYCDQSFATREELIDHAAAVHLDQPPLRAIEIQWR